MTLNYVTKSSFLTILTALLFTTFSLQAQTYNYSDNWGKAGYTLENLSRSNVTISYSIEEISLEVNKVNGMDMQNIILPGNILPNDEGAPDLPGTSRFVAIPNGSKAVLNVLEYRKETFQNIEMAPAPRIPLDTDKGPLHYEKNAKIYTEDAFYPANPFRISEITEIRGVNAVIFGITPFQYNPVTKELIVYRDVKVEIIFEGGTGEFGTDRLRSR
nr:hypothetical protein [Bacteroidota bacterium]